MTQNVQSASLILDACTARYSCPYRKPHSASEQSRIAQCSFPMIDFFRLLACTLTRLFRSRARLEAEILVLRHQLNVLRRRSPKRVAFSSIDRLVFAGLYRLAPGVLDALKILKPETVIRWHRVGFRAYWRWKSRSRGWSTEDTTGDSPAHSRYEYCEPALGCTADPRRTPHARHRCRANDSSEVHGEAKATAVARMEDLSSQSRRRHRIDGFVCRPHDLLPAAIWIFDSSASPPRDRVARCDRASDCRMDRSPTHGSIRLGTDTTIHHSRSGWGLW